MKYVNSNSILSDNVQNQVFKKFIDFVERMLLFYSLDSRGSVSYTHLDVYKRQGRNWGICFNRWKEGKKYRD